MRLTASLALLAADEATRLADLHELGILDAEADEALDRLVQMAALVGGTSMAARYFVEADRLWGKSRVGGIAQVVPRHAGLCSHTILQADAAL